MMLDNVLRRKEDFDNVYKRGKSVAHKYIVLFYKKNNLGFNRTAFLASKKVGNSVTRNRARRIMRAAFRNLNLDSSLGYDLIIVARNTIVGKKESDARFSLRSCLIKAKVINNEKDR